MKWKMNQKNVYRPKLEEAWIENTEAGEKQWKVLTHMYLKFHKELQRERERECGRCWVEEIMAENISELMKNI